MNEYTAIIRSDYRVGRESIHDLKMEIARLANLGLIVIEGSSKEILVVRSGVFVGWLSVYCDCKVDGYIAQLERPTTNREETLWQMLVDLLD